MYLHIRTGSTTVSCMRWRAEMLRSSIKLPYGSLVGSCDCPFILQLLKMPTGETGSVRDSYSCLSSQHDHDKAWCLHVTFMHISTVLILWSRWSPGFSLQVLLAALPLFLTDVFLPAAVWMDSGQLKSHSNLPGRFQYQQKVYPKDPSHTKSVQAQVTM